MRSENVTRFVESLLDISKAKPLSHFIRFPDQEKNSYKSPASSNGLYAFWLDNQSGIAEKLHRNVEVTGPAGLPKQFEWDWHVDDKYILLYVGKSTNLKKRLSLHLKLGTKEWKTEKELNKITTSCQLRAGIEHLLQHSQQDSFEFMSEYVLAHFLPDEDDDLVKRFFAEDLAIGKGLPWFNVDSER